MAWEEKRKKAKPRRKKKKNLRLGMREEKAGGVNGLATD